VGWSGGRFVADFWTGENLWAIESSFAAAVDGFMKSVHRIRRGLRLPIAGSPLQQITSVATVRSVALLGDDYIGMKPTMRVRQGDRVLLGQPLFEDKMTAGVTVTSPATGTVGAIHRGEKRKFESLVIDIDAATDEQKIFNSYRDVNLKRLSSEEVRSQLLASGLWTALRKRPFSRIPAFDSRARSIFVTAMDTNPLSADPAVVLATRPAEFVSGLEVLSTLSDGPLRVCQATGVELPGEGHSPAEFHAFDGPHPAGLVGTHIHLLSPVDGESERAVWHIGYQDVIAIGHLFLTGKILGDRVVAIAGPVVEHPRLVRTRLGASLTEISREEVPVDAGPVRVISGSVLSGRRSAPPVDFLGRYHNQITFLAEGGERELLGWLRPGLDKFSIRRVFASSLDRMRGRSFPMNTSAGGSPRAMVPIGMYEDVMPLDFVATPLLKALITGDTEYAQKLGVLELDEEDLALCTFVCPGKYEYGPLLRQSLTRIEAEG
jgi:Na+-transporting NADH:ubiquinone oxidoreductase subunit A